MAASTRENLRRFWDYENNSEFDVETIGVCSRQEVCFVCENGHRWKKRICDQSDLKNCQDCTTLWFKYPHLIEQWDFEKNTVDFYSLKSTSKVIVWWKCPDCLGSTQVDVGSKIHQRGCSFCKNKKLLKGFNDLETKMPEMLKQWDYKKNTIAPSEILYNSGVKVFWRCQFGHSFEMAVAYKTIRKYKCVQCKSSKEPEIVKHILYEKYGIDEQWLLDNYVNSELSIDDIYKKFGMGPSVLKKGLQAYGLKKDRNLIVKNKNDKRFKTNFEKYGNYNPAAFAVSPSTYEMELYGILTEDFGLKVMQNDRTVIAPKEIDIWLPAEKIAVEFNGIYWHDKALWLEDIKNGTCNSREAQKTKACEELGLKIFHIWEDDWNALKTKVDKIVMIREMLTEAVK